MKTEAKRERVNNKLIYQNSARGQEFNIIQRKKGNG